MNSFSVFIFQLCVTPQHPTVQLIRERGIWTCHNPRTNERALCGDVIKAIVALESDNPVLRTEAVIRAEAMRHFEAEMSALSARTEQAERNLGRLGAIYNETLAELQAMKKADGGA